VEDLHENFRWAQERPKKKKQLLKVENVIRGQKKRKEKSTVKRTVSGKEECDGGERLRKRFERNEAEEDKKTAKFKKEPHWASRKKKKKKTTWGARGETFSKLQSRRVLVNQAHQNNETWGRGVLIQKGGGESGRGK